MSPGNGDSDSIGGQSDYDVIKESGEGLFLSFDAVDVFTALVGARARSLRYGETDVLTTRAGRLSRFYTCRLNYSGVLKRLKLTPGLRCRLEGKRLELITPSSTFAARQEIARLYASGHAIYVFSCVSIDGDLN